jgi:hypothetical protein
MNAPILTRDGDCPACAGEGFDYVLHGCRQDVVRCHACHGSGVKLTCGTCADNGPACTCNAPGGYCSCGPCRECGGVS